MATRPTPEESARKVLYVFVSFKVRAGEYLPDQSLRSGWEKLGLHFDDLAPGIDYSLQQGWIENKPEHPHSLWLTTLGFSEA